METRPDLNLYAAHPKPGNRAPPTNTIPDSDQGGQTVDRSSRRHGSRGPAARCLRQLRLGIERLELDVELGRSERSGQRLGAAARKEETTPANRRRNRAAPKAAPARATRAAARPASLPKSSRNAAEGLGAAARSSSAPRAGTTASRNTAKRRTNPNSRKRPKRSTSFRRAGHGRLGEGLRLPGEGEDRTARKLAASRPSSRTRAARPSSRPSPSPYGRGDAKSPRLTPAACGTKANRAS